MIVMYAFQKFPNSLSNSDIHSLNEFLSDPFVSFIDMEPIVNATSRLATTVSNLGGHDVTFLFSTFMNHVVKFKLFEQMSSPVNDYLVEPTLNGWLDQENQMNQVRL